MRGHIYTIKYNFSHAEVKDSPVLGEISLRSAYGGKLKEKEKRSEKEREKHRDEDKDGEAYYPHCASS